MRGDEGRSGKIRGWLWWESGRGEGGSGGDDLRMLAPRLPAVAETRHVQDRIRLGLHTGRAPKELEGNQRELEGLDSDRLGLHTGRAREESDGLGRTPKDSEGLRRAPKGSEGLRRAPKDSEGLRRARKDSEGLRRDRKGSRTCRYMSSASTVACAALKAPRAVAMCSRSLVRSKRREACGGAVGITRSREGIRTIRSHPKPTEAI